MEVVMIAGTAALAVAGLYSIKDLLADIGYCRSKGRSTTDYAAVIYTTEALIQRNIKKMPRLHV